MPCKIDFNKPTSSVSVCTDCFPIKCQIPVLWSSATRPRQCNGTDVLCKEIQCPNSPQELPQVSPDRNQLQ